MSEILVNRRPIPLDSGQKTWAEVLATVDARTAAEGLVVTAVRFGGVDQPSFRDADLGATAVAGVGRIEIDAWTRARLLSATLSTAGASLAGLASGACRAATAFRRGELADGHEQFGMLLATVRTLVDLTLASAAAAGTDLHGLRCGSESAAGILEATGVVLDTLAQHQQVEDWIAVADELEYGLAPALLGWGVVFEAMQEASAA